ncbi:MAG TPA: bifunctional diaminohydroxyphosphoribosylaminopyrimidine deaminase/5-amino-6-(5-phosphoribosylamino)uracil reductase RibD [Pyrinomonadaceae bacterium]|nr:bifunctional diaminohydroxyphosphoribosylaminopyrimidine deaminase/5-amino-6-(5-phosphoribosylamino)uracil reductase RibD [Pyrinomonadaceae bacterium]
MQEIKTTASEAVEHSTEFDRLMMARALELALKGQGQVSPGPLVGCVIASPSGEVIGEGFYVYEAVKHAETIAIEQAGGKTEGATAYVSLEPHAHHGRTPPCTDALIAAGVTKVIAPIEDPNPKVSGSGFAHLRSVGIEVHTGLMANEAARLNEKYLHFMRTGRPFVHLKLAASLDGKIATRTRDSRWITGEAARVRAHDLRNEYDAILVGIGTALADDPRLTDRSGKPRTRPLVRVVLDENLRLPLDSTLVTSATKHPVLIFAGQAAGEAQLQGLESLGVEVVKVGRDPLTTLEELGSHALQSVLIEGGARVASQFVEAGLVDKVTFFIAPVLIGGQEAPSALAGLGAATIAEAMRLQDVDITQHGQDFEITGYPAKPVDR